MVPCKAACNHSLSAPAVHIVAQDLTGLSAGAGSRDCTVKLWDLESGVQRAGRRSPVGSVRSIAMDEDVLVRFTSSPAHGYSSTPA